MRTPRSRLARLIALASVLVVAGAVAIFGYARWQHQQEVRSLLRRSTNGRSIAQALVVFANQNRDSYPLPGGKNASIDRPPLSIEDTLRRLVFDGSLPVECMEPGFLPEGFEGPWWLFASDPRIGDFAASEVLLYENPALNTDHILIVFNDAHVKACSREEAMDLVESQLAESRRRHPSFTWPVPLLPPARP